MKINPEAGNEMLKNYVKGYCDSNDLIIPQGAVFERHCEFYTDQIEEINLPDIDADQDYTKEAEQVALKAIFNIAVTCVLDWRCEKSQLN